MDVLKLLHQFLHGCRIDLLLALPHNSNGLFSLVHNQPIARYRNLVGVAFERNHHVVRSILRQNAAGEEHRYRQHAKTQTSAISPQHVHTTGFSAHLTFSAARDTILLVHHSGCFPTTSDATNLTTRIASDWCCLRNHR
jgi:hypothetical protein